MPSTRKGKRKQATSEPPPPPPVVDEYAARRIEEGAHWRLDPAESFSDWTIQVRRPSGVVDEYNVHKILTSLGRRACKKLRVEFTQDFVEKEASSSTYEFSDEIGDWMPTFLDYIYIGSIDLTPENALPIHTLADYLDVVRLRDEVRTFVFESYPLDQIHTCYEEACRLFGEQGFQKHLQNRLAKYINGADDSSDAPKASSLPLWRLVDATFLRSLWPLLDGENNDDASMEMCRIIAIICEHQEPDVVPAAVLCSLLGVCHCMAPDVAPLIMKHIDAADKRAEETESKAQYADTRVTLKEERDWVMEEMMGFLMNYLDPENPKDNPLVQSLIKDYPAAAVDLVIGHTIELQKSPEATSSES